MDLLNNELNTDWIKAIDQNSESHAELMRVGIVGGGSINDARKIETSKGVYFAKLNDADMYPGMFDAEVTGLEFLRENSPFNIPTPVGSGVTGSTQWILMEYIQSTAKDKNYWENFGKNLAEMHKKSNEKFGFKSDNYLGSLPQKNVWKENWPEFFAENRIAPQLRMAKDSGEASSEMVRLLEKVMGRAEKYFPKEPPSVVHGDMWTGNFTTDASGQATIYDPAAHYGHREMDIAMSKLFGGYDTRFYEAYNEHFPLEKGWQDRLPVANLYPLLAHLNIFGGSYASQIMGILRRNI